ncbi:hypothetical protein [Streptomyces sp. NPDC020298]|uniref:hypothetical protein n=1 Tax=Streptomyces sp. NPDC020298 TaxID=3155010 RepID=UPI0034074E73
MAASFTGLSPRQFSKLITALWREGTDPVRKGRPWKPAAGGPGPAKAAVGKATVIADCSYRETGLVILYRRERGQAELTPSSKAPLL